MKLRKVFCGILLSLCFCVPAAAYPTISVYVDGVKVSFDQAPVLENGRTLVPMNAIFTAMGAEVEWIEQTRSVVATHEGNVFQLNIGESEIYKNNTLLYTMEVPAKIIGNRTMVPVRVISESLGGTVLWDENTYTVSITTPMDGTTVAYLNTTIPASDGTAIIKTSIAYPVIQGSSAAVSRINQELYQQAQTIEQNFLATNLLQAQNAYATSKASGGGFSPYYMTGTATVTYYANDMVSAMLNTTSYTGGALEYGRQSANFVTSSGRTMVLSDITSDDTDEINEAIIAGFSAMIEASPAAFYSDSTTRVKQNIDQVQFYLSDGALNFFFDSGVIAPKEAGIVGFGVAFNF